MSLYSSTLRVIPTINITSVTPIKIRLIFSRINKNIHSEYPFKRLLSDYRWILNDRILKIEKHLSFYLSQADVERKLENSFMPSKTAQMSLNFITKKDELNLGSENIIHSDETLKIIKIIYILLKKNPSEIDDHLLAYNLTNKIMKNLKIESISKYFFKERKFVFKRDYSQRCFDQSAIFKDS